MYGTEDVIELAVLDAASHCQPNYHIEQYSSKATSDTVCCVVSTIICYIRASMNLDGDNATIMDIYGYQSILEEQLMCKVFQTT